MINRGNYRHDVFLSEGAKAAFECCLFEACEKSKWVLHAFVIMRNHYHLALETPEGNLVAGMQWLQATYANRFNRLRSERGHLFQGRYKALLVEEGDALGAVCHYSHLNPVRAGICGVNELAAYRYSSYFYLNARRIRPPFLSVTTALTAAGQLTDSVHGRKMYAAYLEWQASDGPAGKSKAYVNMSRGWALGGTEFKQGLLHDHALVAHTRAWESLGAREMRELQWARSLLQILERAERTEKDLIASPKSVRWKLTLACWMKCYTQASNKWLCLRMNLGTPAAFSRNLSHYRKRFQSNDPLWRMLTSSSAT